MNKKQIFYISFFIILIWIIFYISSYVWVLEFILSIIIYFLIFYFFHFIFSKFRKKKVLDFKDFSSYFLYRVSIFLIIILSLIWWFSFYSNEISPALMPEYTISNWKKTIVFQTMSHIWSENFYEKIKNNLKEKKESWFVYFFEWVKPGTLENMEKFNKAIKIKFDENLYKNYSKLYWITHQDNSHFLWLVNNLDFNIDLSIDEIVSEYENIKKPHPWIPSPLQEKETTIIDANKEILNKLAGLNNKQLKILVYINQAILNLIIKSEWIQGFLTKNFTNKNLFKVILDKRNEILSKEILKSKYNKIYLTYWLMHFKWVFELLKENDNNWKIINKKEFILID
jgi:hypothetical protein